MESSIKDEVLRKQLENQDLRQRPFVPDIPMIEMVSTTSCGDIHGRKATTEIKTDDSAMATLAVMQAELAKDREKHNIETQKVEEFKKSYIKIRTDNIVLDHQSAIELAKMIHQEADTITYDDIC